MIGLVLLLFSQPSPLSLEQAIRTALEHNPRFAVFRKDLEKAATRIDFEEGAFAPRLFADLRLAYSKAPRNDPGGLFEEDQILRGSLGVEGRWRSGLNYRLEWATLYEDLVTTDPSYDPYQTTQLRLTLQQPLLRNAWFAVNRAPTVVATHQRDASNYLLRAQVERVVADVEVAYWSLVLALKELEIRQEAVSLANQQVEQSKKLIKIGSVAEVDLIDSEAQAGRVAERIPESKQNIAEAQGRLLALLQPELAGIDYLPTTLPDLAAFDRSLEECLAAAEKNRPDLAAAIQDLQAAEVLETVAHNRLMPALDLTATLGIMGLSGSVRDGDPELRGNFFDMYGNLEYPNATVGITFQLPLDNSQAEADYRLQAAETARRRALIEALRTQIRYEVITAYKQLEADYERVRAAADTMKRAEALLTAQRLRFSRGAGVSFDVARSTSAAIRARIAHLRANVRGRISRARLLFAQGVYLEAHSIEVAGSAAP